MYKTRKQRIYDVEQKIIVLDNAIATIKRSKRFSAQTKSILGEVIEKGTQIAKDFYAPTYEIFIEAALRDYCLFLEPKLNRSQYYKKFAEEGRA